MTIEEDRDEFNNTGLRKLLREIMAATDEAFILITDDGWNGKVTDSRPRPGSGAYLHYQRGYPVRKYRNEGSGPDVFEVFKAEV